MRDLVLGCMGVLLLLCGVWVVKTALDADAAANVDTEEMIPASKVKESMQEMKCKRVSEHPDMWTCEHARAFCIVLNPSSQAQLQCRYP